MRRLAMSSAIMICMICTAPLSLAEQLKTGIMKTAPSPNQITSTPTPQVPAVKTAPGVAAPVPTKQGTTAPLGQKAAIAVKSPAQGTQHPTGKPLPIIWDRSSISTVASVNILLMDRPGGTVKATIKAGAPNTGSFTSWIAPQQYGATGNSWAIRIEAADSKASGHSGVFSFQAAVAAPSTIKATAPSLTSGRSIPGQDASAPAAPEGQTNKIHLLEELKTAIAQWRSLKTRYHEDVERIGGNPQYKNAANLAKANLQETDRVLAQLETIFSKERIDHERLTSLLKRLDGLYQNGKHVFHGSYSKYFPIAQQKVDPGDCYTTHTGYTTTAQCIYCLNHPKDSCMCMTSSGCKCYCDDQCNCGDLSVFEEGSRAGMLVSMCESACKLSKKADDLYNTMANVIKSLKEVEGSVIHNVL